MTNRLHLAIAFLSLVALSGCFDSNKGADSAKEIVVQEKEVTQEVAVPETEGAPSTEIYEEVTEVVTEAESNISVLHEDNTSSSIEDDNTSSKSISLAEDENTSSKLLSLAEDDNTSVPAV